MIEGVSFGTDAYVTGSVGVEGRWSSVPRDFG